MHPEVRRGFRNGGYLSAGLADSSSAWVTSVEGGTRPKGWRQERIHFLPQVDKMQNVKRIYFMNVTFHHRHTMRVLYSWLFHGQNGNAETGTAYCMSAYITTLLKVKTEYIKSDRNIKSKAVVPAVWCTGLILLVSTDQRDDTLDRYQGDNLLTPSAASLTAAKNPASIFFIDCAAHIWFKE